MIFDCQGESIPIVNIDSAVQSLHQLHFNVDDHSSIKAIVVTWSASHPCEHRSHLGCPP